MISNTALEKLAAQYQTSIFPNVLREYFQHVFLSGLSAVPESDKILFKGGTALRIVYGSSRFSEDLDFSMFGVGHHDVKRYVEDIFVKVLADIEQTGIKVELGEKSDKTSGGYFGVATFHMADYQPVGVEINISSRNGKIVTGEIDTIANDFVPTYTLLHLPQIELVEEKIFGALRERKKPRDFYDLYFMMRKGMLTSDQKTRLSTFKKEIITNAAAIDFRGELGTFLPTDQQSIIRDFIRAFESELERQTA